MPDEDSGDAADWGDVALDVPEDVGDLPEVAEDAEVPAGAWLDAAPLLGQGGDSKREDLAWRARTADVAMLRRALAAGLAAHPKAGGVFALADPLFGEAWRTMGAAVDSRPGLHLALPNVRSLIREATEHGMMRAGLRHVLRIGPLGVLSLGVRNIGEAPGVLRRDFPTALRLLTRVELAEARHLPGLATVLLAQQMTDLALAMRAPRLLEDFVANAARVAPAVGFVTANPAQLSEQLTRASGRELLETARRGGLPLRVVARRGGAAVWPEGVEVISPNREASAGSRLVSWPLGAAAEEKA